jgi:phosphopantetheinyl transferase (holo-ACP synthase)
MLERNWVTHLSLSHEREHATAMVVLEEVKTGLILPINSF